MKPLFAGFWLLFSLSIYSQTLLKDSETQKPVAFATISFGNGHGIFADDEGLFIYKKKLYPDVDTLYISALGYKDKIATTATLPQTLLIDPEPLSLKEVVVTAKNEKKYTIEEQKPYLDDDYFKCWLPSIESEIAVYFENNSDRLKKIEKVQFPISTESKDWSQRNKKNADKRPFSTLFKVKFYSNENGLPGKVLNYSPIVFNATEKNAETFQLDVSDHDIYVTKDGLFVSLQVLGYTDKNGKLLPNKKYREIRTAKGMIKVATNFRPLLPFTDQIGDDRTFVKRIFVQDNKWVQFSKNNINESNLLEAGLNNYGIGLTFRVYKD